MTDRMRTEANLIAEGLGVERGPNEDIMSWLARGVAELTRQRTRAIELREQSTTIAEDRTRERDEAMHERDAAALALVNALALPGEQAVEARRLACRALDLFGIELQINQAAEEAAELFVELSHQRRGRGSRPDLAAEIVDVEFMCFQLREWLGVKTMQEAERVKMTKVRAMIEREEMSQ